MTIGIDPARLAQLEALLYPTEGGDRSELADRATHVLHAILLKPHDALTQFDALEACAVIVLLMNELGMKR